MKIVLTSKQMKDAENAYFKTGVSSLSVMETAAKALTEEIVSFIGGTEATVVFACGSGGNGGDGYAAARLYAQRGGRAIVLEVYPPKTEDAKINCEKAKKACFHYVTADSLSSLPRPDAWVDAIFGIGITRPLEETALSVVQRINRDKENGSKVISADIPSGLHADTGEILNECVYADKTVCFQHLKRAHLAGMGLEACGETVVKDIQIPESFFPEEAVWHIEPTDMPMLAPKRRRAAHKNDFGHLLIVAGSFGMAGACAFSANAAMRSGAGLVTVACPSSIVPILQALAPSAMCIPLPEENGAISERAVPALEKALQGKSAIAAGPGLTRSVPACVLKTLLSSDLPAVFDADALNIISENQSLISLLSPRHAITPHPGEAARLLGKKLSDPFITANMLHALHCQALLKGASSVIHTDKGIFISSSGTSAMAKGGSGDVLTGMVGAFLAQGKVPSDALLLASEIHGLAGENAEKHTGCVSLLPSDIIDSLKEAFRYAYPE